VAPLAWALARPLTSSSDRRRPGREPRSRPLGGGLRCQKPGGEPRSRRLGGGLLCPMPGGGPRWRAARLCASRSDTLRRASFSAAWP